MGNDGGSIPKRRELVKNAARNPNTTELKATQLEAQTHAWQNCPLSGRPLADPIVSDSAGVLYNKDAILEELLPKEADVPAAALREREALLQGRVKSLRDVVEIKFTTARQHGGPSRWVCPITSKELGPSTRAVYLVPCGHAFSEAAMRELQGDACVECNEPYASDNIIPILPLLPADRAKLSARATKLKDAGLTHALKKAPGSKKRKKQAVDQPEQASHHPQDPPSAPTAQQPQLLLTDPSHQPTTTPPAAAARSGTSMPLPAGIKNAATASLTAKVLTEQEARNKRRKLGMNDNLKSLFTDKGHVPNKNADFMTRGFSISK